LPSAQAISIIPAEASMTVTSTCVGKLLGDAEGHYARACPEVEGGYFLPRREGGFPLRDGFP